MGIGTFLAVSPLMHLPLGIRAGKEAGWRHAARVCEPIGKP